MSHISSNCIILISFSEERFPPYISPRFFLRLEVYDVTKREALLKTFCEVSHKVYPRRYYCECGCRVLMYDEETSE